MSATWGLMSIRKLFAMLVAFAVLFAPSVAYASMPMAMSSHHDLQMMEMGHCETPPASSGDHHKSDGMTCCMSMCMAIGIAPDAPVALAEEPSPAMLYAPVRVFWHGRLAEIATPPPRRA